MTTKKPGDETIRGSGGFEARSEDSFVGGKYKVSLSDLKKAAEAAPEVSQGAWRERVFTPRAVMSREEVKAGLQSSLRVALASVNQPRVAMEKVRPAWLPLLRQALEQAGGDGIDAWLQTLFSPPGKVPNQPLFTELSEALLRMRHAKDLAGFLVGKGLAKFKCPERIEVIDAFPVTRVGKVDKSALRAAVAAKLGTGAKAA